MKGEESHVNGIDYILNRIIEENFSRLKKDIPYRYMKHIEGPIGKKGKLPIAYHC